MITTGETKSPDRLLDEEFFNKISKSKGMVHQKKDDIQRKALEMSEHSSHLTLSWATGCGKSLAALKIIKDRVESGDTTPWFIVCSELNHIDNWIAEIVKHKLGYLMDYIEIFCYASLSKYRTRTGNLILDESHSVSDLRLEYLQTISAKQIISLSATLNQERKDQLTSLRKMREFHISVTDAINMGILPAPSIYVIYDDMDSTNRYHTYVKTKGDPGSKNVPILETDYDNYYKTLVDNKTLAKYKLNVRCSASEYIELINKDIEYYKKAMVVFGKNSSYKTKVLRLGNDRKTFITGTKTPMLGEVNHMLKVNNMRHITFTGTIEQCDAISFGHSIHSKVSKKDRKSLIDKFNKGEIDDIYAVEMLREGMNLENIHAGIITQLDSENLSFVQMMGRVFRSTDPILFVLIKNNTKDVEYLKKCIDGLDDKYITYVKYNTENMEQLNQILCQRKSKDQGLQLD